MTSRAGTQPGGRPRQRRRATINRSIGSVVVVGLIAILAGCSSLVDGPCAPGYQMTDGTCVERFGPDAAPGIEGSDAELGGIGGTGGRVVDMDAGAGAIDGAIDGAPDGAIDGGASDAGLDASVCVAPEQSCGGTCLDVTGDPLNCGACGHACESGICQAGACAGELSGHVIAIGHDYVQHNQAMARVLGNSVSLAVPHDVAIARLAGTATSAARAGVGAAITASMTELGRPWHAVALPAPGDAPIGIDVLIVDPQTGDGTAAENLGAAYQPTIDALLAAKGVVVVLEGAGGVSTRFASGAGLFAFPAPTDATGQPAFVVTTTDAIVQQVVSPYFADTTSVSWATVAGAIATPAGASVVHLTR